MIRVLYVEDEAALALIVRDSLISHGFEVIHKRNGMEALNAFKKKNNDFDVILLDIMMPIMDGFSLAQQIRKIDVKTPILFLTAMTSTEDVVKGFRLGANDYIRKPFKIEELIVRIEALTKLHKRGALAVDKYYDLGKYSFDTSNGQLTYKEEKIILSFREAELLKILIKHKEEVVSREELMNLSPNEEPYFTGRSLDVFISRLRKYLSQDDSIQIVNIRGVGYKLLVR